MGLPARLSGESGAVDCECRLTGSGFVQLGSGRLVYRHSIIKRISAVLVVLQLQSVGRTERRESSRLNVNVLDEGLR